MLKIKPDVFDNQLYKLIGSKNIVFQLSYIDSSINFINSPSMLNVSNKTIKLTNSLSFSISEHYSIPERIIYDHIKDMIDKEFINRITQLGRSHVESIKKEHFKELDLLIYDFTNSYHNIVYKIQRGSSFITVDSRVGPAQWIISNSKTYKDFLVNLSQDAIFDKNGILKIGDIPYIINEKVTDDIVLLGRKNINESGLHCFIETDEYGYIKFNKSISFGSMVNFYTINYIIEDVGVNTENYYLTLNTRTPNYYRYLKLKKIEEIYGN